MFRSYKEQLSLEKQFKQLMSNWREALNYIEKVLPQDTTGAAKEQVDRINSFEKNITDLVTKLLKENQKLSRNNLDLTLENSQLTQEVNELKARTKSLSAQVEESHARISALEKQQQDDNQNVQRQLDAIRAQMASKTNRMHRTFRALSQAVIAANRFAAGAQVPQSAEKPVQST